MSDAHNEHESIIRTPKQLLFAVAAFFLIIVIGIILLVSFVTNTHTAGAGSDSQSAAAVNARIAPVAAAGFTLRDANAPKVLQGAEAVYTAVCAACHAVGLAGAPKIGDASAWGPRIAQGYETLLKHAIEGIRAMPAKGGNPDLDDVEVARAVVYMTNQSGAKFKEPALPATPVSGMSATTPAVESAPAAKVAATSPPSTAPAIATPPPSAANSDTGKALYNQACVLCHGSGLAGAPKFGDKAAWAPRLAQGTAILYQHAIAGFQGKVGMMPPKGGSSAPDADVKAAVDYMVSAAK
ncbi:MAG: cytochrome c5 family protein [Cytophagaceae bacterium]|nr:MAG: cytochrome c5 family protein [Cytophagaceae bacterium]